MEAKRSKTANHNTAPDEGAGAPKSQAKAKFDSIEWNKAKVEAGPSKNKGVPQANITVDGKNHGVVLVNTVKQEGPSKGKEFVTITGSAGFSGELNAASKEVGGKRINKDAGKTNEDGSKKPFQMGGIKLDADKAGIVADKLATSESAQSQVTAKAIKAALAESEKQKKAASAA